MELLLIRNQNLRWVIVDECFMAADDLLGTFAAQVESGARDTRYKQRHDKSIRVFGGYNVMFLGDVNQLPPIPSTSA